MALGTRMIVMNEGVICQEDSAQNIYNHPGSLFVAGFSGTPRMNLSIAKVTEENGSVVLKFSAGTIPPQRKRKFPQRARLCGQGGLYRCPPG